MSRTLSFAIALTGLMPLSGQEGPGRGNQLAHDKSVFHALLEGHSRLKRTVTMLPDGVETLTESEDPTLAKHLKDHLQAMKTRMEKGHPIRQWDPLFVAIFQEAGKVDIRFEPTAKGVRVWEQSKDPRVARLIQAHAQVVSGFVKRGFDEASREHPLP